MVDLSHADLDLMQPKSLCMCSLRVSDPSLTPQGQKLAQALGLPFVSDSSDMLQLVLTPLRLELSAPKIGGPISIDFVSGKNAHRRQFGGGRGQPFARAIGLKKGQNPSIIDATAGFGRDAFVLASLGCQVTLLEQNTLLVALLQNALQRAYDDDDILPIVSRMQVHATESIDFLTALDPTQHPDVIYLDPMYPDREKAALVKKDMQLLHQLVGEDTQSTALLRVALQKACKRVVVKRPKNAGFVAGHRPNVSISSKNTRYDIYLTQNTKD